MVFSSFSMMFANEVDNIEPAIGIEAQGNRLSSGEDYSFVVMEDGTMWAWGYPTHDNLFWWPSGQSPTKMMHDVVAVSSADATAMAIRSDGSLWGWGANAAKQVDHGWMDWLDRPLMMLEDVVAVSTSNYLTMAIKSDGSLWGWGIIWNGQHGYHGDVDPRIPVWIMDGVIDVYVVDNYAMVIKSDGSLWGWGDNASWQSSDSSAIPVHIMDDVADVSASSGHIMVIRTDGSLWGWGNNESGQLGDGTTTRRINPIHIMNDVASVSTNTAVQWIWSGFEIISIELGSHTMAIKTDGSLWGWGDNANWQLGDGTAIERHNPTWIMNNVVEVSTSSRKTTAICSNYQLWGWGFGYVPDVWNGNLPQIIPHPVHNSAIEIQGTVGEHYYAWLGNYMLSIAWLSSWDIIDGELPPGLYLDYHGGIFGIPTTAGSFKVTFQKEGYFTSTYLTAFFSIDPPFGHNIHISAPNVTAQAGEYIDITFSLNDVHGLGWHEGLSIISLDIFFDDWFMQRTGDIVQGNVFDGAIVQPPIGANPFRVNLGMANVLDVTHATGDLITVRFKVNEHVWTGMTSSIWANVVGAHRLENFTVVPVDVSSSIGGITIVEVVTHPITILNGGAGAFVNPNPAEAGQIINIYAGDGSRGHVFAGWEVISPSNLHITHTDSPTESATWFVMPDEPAIIRATWEIPITARVYLVGQDADMRRGQNVFVYAGLSENQGLSSLSLSLNYDPAVFEKIEIMPMTQTVMQLPVHPPLNANPFLMNFNLQNPLGVTIETGTLALIQFRVLDDAPLGHTYIGIEATSAFRMEGFTPIPVGVETTIGEVYIHDSVLLGDLNNDGVVDSVDLMLLRLYLAGHNVPINREAADVNVDGVIDIVDEILLSMYLAGHPIILGPQRSLAQRGFIAAEHQQAEMTYTISGFMALDNTSEAFGRSIATASYVDVIINLDNNQGISTLSLDLGYDASVLQRVSINPSDIMQMPVKPPTNAHPFTMNFNSDNPLDIITDTGNLVTVRFRVLDSAALETTHITVNVNGAYRIENFAPVVGIVDLVIETVVQP